MLSLFDAPILPGLASQSAMVTDAEERALIAAIDGSGLTPFRFQGWTEKRLTTSFGFHYDFETQRAVHAAPIPDWLLPLRARMAAFGTLHPEHLVQALLIGDGDRPRWSSTFRSASAKGEATLSAR